MRITLYAWLLRLMPVFSYYQLPLITRILQNTVTLADHRSTCIIHSWYVWKASCTHRSACASLCGFLSTNAFPRPMVYLDAASFTRMRGVIASRKPGLAHQEEDDCAPGDVEVCHDHESRWFVDQAVDSRWVGLGSGTTPYHQQ